eukprot:scaffold5018_cov89-Isochrysis_galbana.AAC.2
MLIIAAIQWFRHKLKRGRVGCRCGDCVSHSGAGWRRPFRMLSPTDHRCCHYLATILGSPLTLSLIPAPAICTTPLSSSWPTPPPPLWNPRPHRCCYSATATAILLIVVILVTATTRRCFLSSCELSEKLRCALFGVIPRMCGQSP